MQYLLMLYADEQAGAAIPKEQMARVMDTMFAYQAALTKAGAFVATGALTATSQAKTLRMEGGTPKVSDAPRSRDAEDKGLVFT